MTAPHIVDPAGLLGEALAEASPDLMRSPKGGRRRGSIERRGQGYRVRVYVGIDPVTKAQLYLRETISAGPDARREAEKALTRLQHQVDQKRAPRTSATLAQLLDRYLEMGTAHLAPRTRREYKDRAAKHIRPMLGSTQIGKIDVFVLEALYADLAKCRDHCHRRKYIDHRTSLPHACDEHGEAGPCSPPDPGCRRCQRMCRRTSASP
jgi:integrase